MDYFFDTEVGEQSMDVSASTRKFQQSIIVVQDPNKAGALASLREAEESTTQQPQASAAQTQTPTQGYS